jgi:pre-mRNA-splicing factor ATP-dependent RNA helicase DHX15/PRP43
MNNIGILDTEGKNPNPFTKKPYSEEYKKLAKVWKNYPVYKDVNKYLSIIKENQVVLLESTTGSGKTVLIPKFLMHVLNYEKNIIVSFPKQITTEESAAFAATTMDVVGTPIIGYRYRGAPKEAYGHDTKMLYATDGTIVSMLMRDPLLSNYHGLVIDEAHERNISIDMLLYLAKQILIARPEFRLIIMSATIEEPLFQHYFKQFKYKYINVITERLYPIKQLFVNQPINKNDYIKEGIKIMAEIVKSDPIEKNDKKAHDILFFVGSIEETYATCKQIDENKDINITSQKCFEAHRGMTPEQKELVMSKDKGKEKYNVKRKSMVATNIAESSLTIDGIKYVIDSGLVFSSVYDPETDVNKLERKFITQSQVVQRMGRSGRTEPGICYHLYTEDEFKRMKKYPEPAIKTSNILGECLRLLNVPTIMKVDKLTKILSEFIEPPSQQYIDSSIQQFSQLGLITKNDISPLGSIIAKTNLEPMYGLTMFAAHHFNCFNEVLMIISLLEYTGNKFIDIFYKPNEKNKEQYDKFMKHFKTLADASGDIISLHKILQIYKDATPETMPNIVKDNFLVKKKLDVITKNYKRMLGSFSNSIDKVPKIVIPDNHKFDLHTNIIAAFAFGFRTHIAKILPNNQYNTPKLPGVNLGKDSFLAVADIHPPELLFLELFMMYKANLNCVTVVSPNAGKLKDYLINNMPQL